MYLAIDIGGTKTLLAVFDNQGSVLEQIKFPTPHDYPLFLEELKKTVGSLRHKEFEGVVSAAPGLIDHEHGIAKGFGNLDWINIPIRDDLSRLVGQPVIIENDAKLAALSEAQLVKEEFGRVLYITISTGIGIGLVVDGKLDKGMLNSEGGQILVEHEGKLVQWEDVASGRSIVERFGKRASDIDDEATWKIITKDIALGLIDLIAVIQPEIIIVGGGVGTHFAKYGHLLEAELKKYETPLVPIPVLRQAGRAEEAVIYGCLELLKQAQHEDSRPDQSAS